MARATRMIGSARTSAGLRVVGAEEGELVLRGRNLIKIGAEESGGAFSFWLGTLPRGKGPPLHVHEFEDETFFILDGEFEILLASQAIRSGPGTCVFFPRQRPHTFRSVTPTGRALLLATPGDGLVSFFRAVGDADSETREGMLLRERLGRQYGLSFLREGVRAAAGQRRAAVLLRPCQDAARAPPRRGRGRAAADRRRQRRRDRGGGVDGSRRGMAPRTRVRRPARPTLPPASSRSV